MLIGRSSKLTDAGSMVRSWLMKVLPCSAIGRRRQFQELYSVGSSPITATKLNSPVAQLAGGNSLKNCTVWVRVPPGPPKL